MTSKEWKECKLSDFMEFNPKEILIKGTLSKKITMETLKPYCRDISNYELTKYNGGTKFKNGDTIMARITPCLENGKTAQVNILDNNEVGFGSTEYIVFRAILNISNKDFIYYLAISPKLRDIAIKSMVGSSGRQRVQTDVLANMEMFLPPLETQEKIASILSVLDDKIELNNSINNNLEQQVLSLYKEHILEKYSGVKNGSIGDYCNVKSGFAFKSSWWKDQGIRVLKIKNIDNDGVSFNDCSFVEEDKVDLAKEFKVVGGDVLIAMTGATIGKFAIVPKTDETLLVNQRVGKFFIGDDPIKKLPFLYCTLKQNDVIAEIINRGQGSAQPNVCGNDILTTPCIIPTMEQIEYFNKICKPFFELIINNRCENLKLSQLRDTLLPKLMSGEIDVEKINIFSNKI